MFWVWMGQYFEVVMRFSHPPEYAHCRGALGMMRLLETGEGARVDRGPVDVDLEVEVRRCR